MDLQEYRASEAEQARTADLLRLIPKDRNSALDIGARDGYFSRLLAEHFDKVVALDLKRPAFSFPGVETAGGNVTDLQFEDDSFDFVLCTEVLEHVPALQRACDEITRVTKHKALIGVPYRQDTRVGRTTCRTCGKTCPPWGHVNSFDQSKLKQLFSGMRAREVSFVGRNASETNSLSTYLMDLAGNPWGSYDQDEHCIHCDAQLIPPPAQRSVVSRVASALAFRLNTFQETFVKPRANWIHTLFEKI